jgi:spermidine synthase
MDEVQLKTMAEVNADVVAWSRGYLSRQPRLLTTSMLPVSDVRLP